MAVWGTENPEQRTEAAINTTGLGDACPHCGSAPRLLPLPFGAKPLLIGGAERCRCRAIAESERQLAEAAARKRQHEADAFWRVSQFGAEFRAARLDTLTWPTEMQPAVAAGRALLAAGTGGLLLYGPPGVGKSLFCCALLNEAAATGVYAIPATLPHLMAEMRASWDHDHDGASEGWLTSRVASAAWVLLDDLGDVGAWGRDKLFELANARWMRRDRLVTLATSNMSPDRLAGRIGDRVVSRLVDMCRVIYCSGEDQRAARARRRKVEV